MSKTLFKNGYVVTMDSAIGDMKNCDVLVENDKIIEIGNNLDSNGGEVIDATNCIVMPGFVDTHRHVWQSILKGTAADWSLFDYVTLMRMAYPAFYTPDDAYLANYVGALESLNAGITTVVDHSHLINSPEHVDKLVDGLTDSGTRGIFCYGFYVNPKYNPFSMESGPGWRYEDARRTRKERLADDSGRILFGVNPSEYAQTPTDVLKFELDLSRKLGSKVISAHVGMGYYSGPTNAVLELVDAGLIGSDMLFVHGSGLTEKELDAIKAADAATSSTPEVDMQMGMGHPVGMKHLKRGIRTSLGLDIISSYSAEMFTQMRMILASQRNEDNDAVMNKLKKAPGKLSNSVKDAVYLATLGGAEAIHMEDQIGSLTPGKKADIQLIRTDSINMCPVADTNVYAAIVFYANTSNVDTVMVDGKVVKRSGMLVGTDWEKLSGSIKEARNRIFKGYDTVPHEDNIQYFKKIFGDFLYLD